MKKILLYMLYLLVVWGGFRYFFGLSSVIEELWIKPVIWLTPLFWWNLSLDKRITFFEGNWLKSVFWGLVAGLLYWIVIKRGEALGMISPDVFGVALATAVIEEMVFSGFVLGYLQRYIKRSENLLVFLVGGLVVLSRLPILFFDYHLNYQQVVAVCLFVFATAIINGVIRIKSKNVVGSVVARLVLNLLTLI